MTAPIRELTLVRSFKAPRSLVFKMWTDQKHFAQWWGPRGFCAPHCRLDARPGGSIDVRMVGMGQDNPMSGEFLEIDPPRRLVFTTMAFKEPDGSWGIVNHNTLTFEEDDGITRMTLHCVVKQASATIAPALDGMEQGWSESLDKLIELVAREAA
jgi:uncharacterized protein YndB with AHSA1/START domain